MLTNAVVKAAQRRSRAYKIYDEAGLFLHVARTGHRSFRLRFRDRDGREQLLTIGSYPEVALADARDRQRRRHALATGFDPVP